MKRSSLALLALAAAAVLAACGGGGSSGVTSPPTTGPTNTPTQYTATIHFIGALAGNQIQADLRDSLNRRMDSGTATPVPVMIVAPIDTSGCFGYDCVSNGPQGQVQAVVSPAPTSTPVTTFSQNAPDVAIYPTGTPVALPTGVVGEVGIGGTGVQNVQTAGTATASIGSPVNQAVTTNVYQYLAIAADCTESRSSSNTEPGWQWTGTAWIPVSDPSLADVYVTGSKCEGSYGVSGDNGTLNFPGGGTFVSTDSPFAAVAASQWANTYTSMSIATLQIANADGSYNAILVAKTRGGVIFKVFPNSYGGSAGDMDFEGAAEVSGSSVDGF